MELSVFSWGGVFLTKASAFDQARKTIPAGLELGNQKADYLQGLARRIRGKDEMMSRVVLLSCVLMLAAIPVAP